MTNVDGLEKALLNNPTDKGIRDALAVALEKSGNVFEAKLVRTNHTPLPDFELLDECEFYDHKTKQHVKMDRTRLSKIADTQNTNISVREAAPVCCLGHTKDGQPEGNQPPVTGVVTRHQVKAKRDQAGKELFSLWGKPWAKEGHITTFKNNPQRSVELFLNPDAINPIALLGPTTPRRDLALHLFGREYGAGEVTSSGQVIRFSNSENGRQPILFEMRADMGNEKPVKCDTDDEPKDAPPPTEDAAAAPPDADVTPDTDSGDPEFDKKLGESSTMKAIMATLMKISAFVEKAGPIFDELEQEATGAPGDPAAAGMPPGAPPPDAGAGAGAPPGGPPPAGAAPPGAPPSPADAGPPPAPDREGPPKKNSAAFGYGNTNMPNQTFAREPYLPVSVANDPVVVQLQRQVAELAKSNKELVTENATIRLERIQAEVDLALDKLAAEGFAVKPEIDGPYLCKLKREDRETAIQFMRETRAKKDMTPLPGNGQPVIVDAATPVKFERPETPGLGGDPSVLAAARVPEGDYDALVKMASEGRRQGVNLRDFDVTNLTPAHANGVKVR